MGAMTAGRVSFSDQVRAAARLLGFDAVGIAHARGGLDVDFARYQEFVGAGMHGEMGWLAANGAVRERIDGEGILAGARSVVCVARRYPRGNASSEAAGFTSGIARYARGRDYHGFLKRRLRRLAAFVRSLGTVDQPVAARPLCDEQPVLERAWAARSGLGFIGKNGMLIVPGLGSMVLLGEVVTTLELEAGNAAGVRAPRPGEPMSERCGACTRCLDACPTGAFVRPFVLDARRCVAYLTIEQRGPIAPGLRRGMGMHLFGCDDCQTVCPYNAGAGPRDPVDPGDGDPFAPLDRWSRVPLESLLSLDEASWGAVFEGTPLRRAGRAGIARNAAIVLGNRGDPAALASLRAAAEGHDDPMVREAAAWAALRLEERGSPPEAGGEPTPG
jgi:epoxyqueuosine reductase